MGGGVAMTNSSQVWYPPLEPKAQERAFAEASPRLADIFRSTFDVSERLTVGFWDLKAGEQYQFYVSRDPWYMDDGTPGPWLAALMALDGVETRRHIGRYKALMQVYEERT